MVDTPEHVLFATEGLQRFDAAVPPVFIFGSHVGNLLLTDRRLLFLSAGSSGAGAVLTALALGPFTPESVRTLEVSLTQKGSLALPHARLRACAAHRRWDFGRYLRVTYQGDDGREVVTSFITRGPGLGSGWIDAWVAQLAPVLAAAQR